MKSSENGLRTPSTRTRNHFPHSCFGSSGLLQCHDHFPTPASPFPKRLSIFYFFLMAWIELYFPLFYVPFLLHSFHSKISFPFILQLKNEQFSFSPDSEKEKILIFSSLQSWLPLLLEENLICELIESLKLVTFISILTLGN